MGLAGCCQALSNSWYSRRAGATGIEAADMDPQEPFIRRPEATALLVIDMQNDFLLPDAPVPTAGGLELVPVIADLAQRARQAGAPVIFTQEAHRAGRQDRSEERRVG